MVIAIIGILAGMTLTGIAGAKARARATQCASNLRQFGIALHLYAGDHEDRIPPNADGQTNRLGDVWVEGWLGVHGPDCTNTLYLQRSLLSPYLGTPSLWHCPAVGKVTEGGVNQDRVRTLSMNCFLGSPVQSPSATTCRTVTEVQNPGPAATIAFFEERADTINDASFALQWDFQEGVPATWLLRDKPGAQHRKAGQMTFVDGHVELHRWQDPRTLAAPRNDVEMASNSDILWMQRHATSHPELEKSRGP